MLDILAFSSSALIWLLFSITCAGWSILLLNSRHGGSGAPPTVAYTFPWIGSSATMAKDCDSFFATATSCYGPIFGLKAAGTFRYFITSPTLAKAVHKLSKAFVFRPVQTHMSHKIFGMSHRSVLQKNILTDDFYDTVHRMLSPPSIAFSEGLLSSYSKCASAEVVGYIPPDHAVPARVLLFNILYRSSAFAFFGPTFDARGTLDDFIHFDRMFPLLMLELPWPLSQPAIRARERLMKHMRAYVAKPRHGSEYIAYLDHFTQDCDAPEELPAMCLILLWALEANAPLAAYWIVVLSLFHSDGLKSLVEEIDAARIAWDAANPTLNFKDDCDKFIAQSQLPLLNSTIQETLRFTTSSFSIRRVLEPVTFAGYSFRPGEELVCAGRVAQVDGDHYDEPNTFVPRRFMSSDLASTKIGKNNKANMAPFGGGVSMCEGRHFALAELKIFICLLLTYLHIELDPKAERRDVAFDSSRIGLGVLHPKGDVLLSVRRRAVSRSDTSATVV